MSRCSAAGFPAVATALIEARANKDVVDQAGRNALTFAALLGCREAYDSLLAHGVDPNLQDTHGKSASDYLREFPADSEPGGVCRPR